jgi:hypothetical protein
MKVDFEKIATEAFEDELQKIAANPLAASGAVAAVSRLRETPFVAAHEAAIRAAKMAKLIKLTTGTAAVKA